MAVNASCGTDREFEHVVGFYATDDDLASAVSTFLVAGLDDGGAVVLVATDQHRELLKVALATRGFDLEALASEQRCRFFEANQLLAAFIVDGGPDWPGFVSAIEPIITAAERAGGPVMVFGEMVTLLWDQGRLSQAVEVESFWNRLAEDHDFSLFCSYPLRSVELSESLGAVKQVCDSHGLLVELSHEVDAAAVDGSKAVQLVRMFMPVASSIRQARGFVREAISSLGLRQLNEEAVLITSELATNALSHARSPFRVVVSRPQYSGSSIRIAVSDACIDEPRLGFDDLSALGGRGMAVVDRLSQTWGVIAETGGKTVWAELI